jgi:hypothetical protein
MKIVDKTKCATATLGREDLKCGQLYKLAEGLKNNSIHSGDIEKPFLAVSDFDLKCLFNCVRLEDGFTYKGLMHGTRWLPINGYVCIEA